ncbi:nucleoside deaminase [Sphingomicrobium aquimarinum]|uniref:nucleoside deaminase n=1 Tax=Sphingomicrobium aquimarinum TaxID=3133971 RepID=UPI003D7291BD
MKRALELAEAAGAQGDVPVGAVVTDKTGAVIGEGANHRQSNDPTAHAEVLALRAAGSRRGSARLDGCSLWVTLEPCAMCAGAIALARIETICFGAEDPKGGAVVNGPRLFAQPTCHHRPEVMGGLGDAQSAALLRAFFAARR